METIAREDFDYLGIFRLCEARDIGAYVTPPSDGSFLSRNIAYCAEKTCTEASLERSCCNDLLPCSGMMALVLAERMLNNSSRVYVTEFRKCLTNRETEALRVSRECLEEDCARVVIAVRNGVVHKSPLQLPMCETVTSGRYVEGDHKMILIESLERLRGIPFVISPLYGGIAIVPLFKVIH